MTLDRERRSIDLPDAEEPRWDGSVTPGKRSMTVQLVPEAPGIEVPISRWPGAVQKKASGGDAAPADAAPAIAAQGTEGTGSALPHLGAIQRAFGRHDLSGVIAYVGGGAAAASRALGAEAYATGDRVAFTSAPDLHTAAHEAAHVVQQRGGVHLAGGVGSEGDAYERHADQVAGAVVAGESAEALLDSHAGGGARRAVQRTSAKSGADMQLDLNTGAGAAPAADTGVGAASTGDPFRHPYWPTFRARVEALFAAIEPPEGADPLILARAMWSSALSGMEDAQSGMHDAATYQRGQVGGRVAMDSPRFEEAIGGFETAIGHLRTYSSSHFAAARSFGFWSTAAGRELCEATCDLTLETSAIGSLFDKLPTLDATYARGWDPQLWAVLSRAYAASVGKELRAKGKSAHVCIGPGATPGNIFEIIESAAIARQLQEAGSLIARSVVYHAAATLPGNPGKVDFSVQLGSYSGTAWSGADLATARTQADEYQRQHAAPAAAAPATTGAAPPVAAPPPAAATTGSSP